MISMQTYNQSISSYLYSFDSCFLRPVFEVLYHLNQITTAISPKSTSVQTTKFWNWNIHIIDDAIPYDRTLTESVKKFKNRNNKATSSESVLRDNRTGDKLDVLQSLLLYDSSKIKKNNVLGVKIHYHHNPEINSNKLFNACRQRFTSRNILYNTAIINNEQITSCKPSPTNVQMRFFKTERTVNSEDIRNPSILRRIKSWFGSDVSKENQFRKLLGEELTFAALEKSNKQIEKSKNIGSKYIKVDELQNIKAAFVEGYLTGQEQKVHGRAFKILRFAQHFVMTLVGVVILITVFATTGGTMFKIQLGNKIQVDPEEIHVTFDDVKGVEEAKSELMDVVEFLKNPEKFSALGGKLPKGVLLVGPPGTGKTLLARAVAGEAGVPFFHAAGPEFDEVLVGQGARRVRDLFRAAKERSPCVIFIDEIDSVGAKRTNSALHPYANQTINQLLSEMDGFHQNEGVIVLGATNRRQDLDKALLRPGRFDSEIVVDAPDFIGRREILELYLSRILTRNIDADLLAKCTIGFTGADIENMINQAALRAAIEGAEYVTMEYLERARDKIIMGPEGKKKLLDAEENRITAYHESGHALVAYYTKDAMPLHKVTIIPRGRSMGHTSYLPIKDTHYRTKAQLLATMDSCMGGRAAEELIFGQDKVTTGASSDFSNATDIAETMVKMYGMSEKVGFRVHKESDMDGRMAYSGLTKETIDNEVKRLLQESYERAKNILRVHSKEHKLLAEALLKYETLDADDVKALISGKKLHFESNSHVGQKLVDASSKVIL
uniref:AAA+ ATPase domain-containing protein n=1 Tax=Trichogramma kaykai TaxID=54128 RepID=A0ABD2WYU1_9HYME